MLFPLVLQRRATGSIAGAPAEVNMPILPILVAVLSLALAAAAAPLQAGEGPGARGGGDCIDPGRVRGWAALHGQRVLIDAGRRHYLVELSGSCPQLAEHPFLGYHSNHAAGRVCGRDGDRLVPHGSAASRRGDCPIRRLRAVDGDEYARIMRQARAQVASENDAER
jgi:hypothetical protein